MIGQPLSLDLRTRVVAALSGGLSRRAERFGVSAATAVHWMHAVTTTGSCGAKPQGGDTGWWGHRLTQDGSVHQCDPGRD